MKHYCNVIVVHPDGNLDCSVLITGEDKLKVGRKAEKLFLAKCKEYQPNLPPPPPTRKDGFVPGYDEEDSNYPNLDEGYFETDSGYYICITWPLEVKVR